jgi:hypothetical protein
MITEHLSIYIYGKAAGYKNKHQKSLVRLCFFYLLPSLLLYLFFLRYWGFNSGSTP